LLDLQTQLEAQAAELRKLRGQNEELVHNLQDAEKRQKDFYVDLDARVRRFESVDGAAPLPQAAITRPVEGGKEIAANPLGRTNHSKPLMDSTNRELPECSNRLPRFPAPVPAVGARGERPLLDGQCVLPDQGLRQQPGQLSGTGQQVCRPPRVPEALLNIAECQLELKNKNAAKKTLKQLITQFPGSDASDKAKKRLATIK